MISFDRDGIRFQIRAAAVIERNDAVLLHRAIQDRFWALPGGRVELGEHAAATVVREMKEELNEAVECEKLLYVTENFFEYSGRQYHEVGLYFRARLALSSRLIREDGPFEGVDGETRLEFAWFERSKLPQVDVRPAFLRQSLSQSTLAFEHAVQRD